MPPSPPARRIPSPDQRLAVDQGPAVDHGLAADRRFALGRSSDRDHRLARRRDVGEPLLLLGGESRRPHLPPHFVVRSPHGRIGRTVGADRTPDRDRGVADRGRAVDERTDLLEPRGVHPRPDGAVGRCPHGTTIDRCAARAPERDERPVGTGRCRLHRDGVEVVLHLGRDPGHAGVGGHPRTRPARHVAHRHHPVADRRDVPDALVATSDITTREVPAGPSLIADPRPDRGVFVGIVDVTGGGDHAARRARRR